MSKIALVGLGLVGRAWAISFARAGHDVALWDDKPDAAEEALQFADEVLPDLAANQLLRDSPAAVRARMRRAATLEEALDGASHVQESTPEDVGVKRHVFTRLDALAPTGAVLASSTSAILPSRFTESLPGRARCLVVHPINPPYLIPAVEIVPAPWTDAAVVERTTSFIRSAGHAPIVMKKEIDGFVMNRLQGALIEEAFRLVAEGFAVVVHRPVRDHRPQRAGRRARLCEALSTGLRRDLRCVAMARGLVRAGDGYDRGRTPPASAGRPAGGAPGLARPAADGAHRA